MARYVLYLLLHLPLSAYAQGPKEKPAQKKRKPNFTIGKDTTYVTGPIDKDGYIDYETALNEILSKGITPENNANVLLWKAFGPHPEGAKVPGEFFKWMKIAQPPEKGDYFVNLRDFLKVRLKADPEDEWKKFDRLRQQITTRPWTAKDYPDIAAWLRRNEKSLALVVEATKRTHYYHPLVASRTRGKSDGLISASMSSVRECREVAIALAARTLMRVGEKRYDDAWQDLLACHRLGRLIGRGGSLIEGLIGIHVDQTASRADLGFLDDAKPHAMLAKRWLRDLQQLPAMPPLADKLALFERHFSLELIMLLQRDGIGYLHSLFQDGFPQPDLFTRLIFPHINWDPALRNINQMYLRQATAMRLKDRAMREKHMKDTELDFRMLLVNLGVSEWRAETILGEKTLTEGMGRLFGDLALSKLFPATRQVQHAADRAEQTQHNLHIAFALAAYKADEGRYPKTLDALAPKYLATVPTDLFSGKALIYRPSAAGYLLYSVGLNGEDEGGRGYSDDPRGDDLAVRMPLPKRGNSRERR